MLRQGDRLRRLLSRLYGETAGFPVWYDALIAALASAAEARPEDLLRLDERREAEPSWFLAPGLLGYSAYLDRFAGDFSGLEDKVEYLRRLGVRYLHLLPFWEVADGDNDGGFAVVDYRRVRRDLGDIEDLARLTAKLRAAEISLCVDLVLNHTSSAHPWALAAKAGDPIRRAYYHVIESRALVDRYEASLPQIFPETAPGNFTHEPALNGWVWTTFYPFQWDLNWSNPAVFAEMVSVILDLANRGVEAFRLDSAAFLWKALGSDCRNRPETHLILQALRTIVSVVAPAVLLKSEVIGPVAETAVFLGTAEAPECHLTYHSGLMTAAWAALAEESADLLGAVLDQTPPIPDGAGWLTYVRCHDDIGWMSLAPQAACDPAEADARLSRVAQFFTDDGGYSRGCSFQASGGQRVHGLNGMTASLAGLEKAGDEPERARAIARIALLYGLAFAAGGLPLIFMGDELGQANDYGFLSDPDRRHEGRWLHRPRFDEEAAQSSVDPHTLAGRVRARLAQLASARAGLPPLTPETAPRSFPTGDAGVLGMTRGERFRLLFNLSGGAKVVRIPGDRGWRDLLSGERAQGELALPGYGEAWLEAIER